MQVASVTDLTMALEGVTDVKHITGDLVNNLHAAEKHIRKNKLKVGSLFAVEGSFDHTRRECMLTMPSQEFKL